MTLVLAATDELAGLDQLIARREADGLATYDEWWEGVYRVVTGPRGAHGRLILKLGAVLDRLADERGLFAAAPLNIGIDKVDAKVPDIAIFDPDTRLTSPASYETAALVVEILSPGERSGEKLPFYLAKGVREYVEVDQRQRTITWLRNTGSTWEPTDRSDVLDIDVSTLAAIDWPEEP